MVCLDRRVVGNLKAMGWDFLPYAPNEWQWMKFDATGKYLAQEGEPVWAADLTIAAAP